MTQTSLHYPSHSRSCRAKSRHRALRKVSRLRVFDPKFIPSEDEGLDTNGCGLFRLLHPHQQGFHLHL